MMPRLVRAGGRLTRSCRQAFSGGCHLSKRISVMGRASSQPDVKDLAKRAQIAVTDAEAAEWQPKMNSVIEWFGQLQKVDVSGLPPAIHASEHGMHLRPDEPKLNETRAELLAMAPALERGYVRVPKIGTGADAGAAGNVLASVDPTDHTATSPAAEAASAAKPAPGPAPAAGSSSAPAPAKPAAKAASSAADAQAPPTPADWDVFKALDLRVGKIVSCEKHPEADSLYVEKIDVGETEPRTIVSGLVKYVPLDQMQERMVVVICNLKPRNMRGLKSFGMLLAASNEEHTIVEPLQPPADAVPGDRVFAGDVKEQPAPAAANAVEKKKLWDAVQPSLRTGPDCVATWRGQPLSVGAGPLRSATLTGARIA